MHEAPIQRSHVPRVALLEHTYPAAHVGIQMSLQMCCALTVFNNHHLVARPGQRHHDRDTRKSPCAFKFHIAPSRGMTCVHVTYQIALTHPTQRWALASPVAEEEPPRAPTKPAIHPSHSQPQLQAAKVHMKFNAVCPKRHGSSQSHTLQTT